MTQTYKGSLVTKYVIDLLTANRAKFSLQAIHYGDQRIIAASPTVCVVPSRTNRERTGTSFKTRNNFEIGLLIYSTSLRSSSDDVQYNLDQLSESIADFINLKGGVASTMGVEATQFDGLVTEAFVSDIEYGYKVLSDELMRMNRLIITGTSNTRLIENA